MKIGLGSSSVYPLGLESAFRISSELGFDGVEIMVSSEKDTQDADTINKLIEKYNHPVLSIHAPVLIMTSKVFGRIPQDKLKKTAELAVKVGAKTVVVHPPYKWQIVYRNNFKKIVQTIEDTYQVTVAVENMFGWNIRGKEFDVFYPSWDPAAADINSITLDFSHSASQGVSSLDLAKSWGNKIKHVHLCDGHTQKDKFHIFDEHLVPGKGTQPVAETLSYLKSIGFDGYVVAEINTKTKGSKKRIKMLEKVISFARTHTA
jgi:sugar phosphate isomerase/epimerase